MKHQSSPRLCAQHHPQVEHIICGFLLFFLPRIWLGPDSRQQFNGILGAGEALLAEAISSCMHSDMLAPNQQGVVVQEGEDGFAAKVGL